MSHSQTRTAVLAVPPVPFTPLPPAFAAHASTPRRSWALTRSQAVCSHRSRTEALGLALTMPPHSATRRVKCSLSTARTLLLLSRQPSPVAFMNLSLMGAHTTGSPCAELPPAAWLSSASFCTQVQCVWLLCHTHKWRRHLVPDDNAVG